MALKVRKGMESVVRALVSSVNAWRRTEALEGGYYHADVTSTTSGDYTTPTATALTATSADATTLGTTMTLANELKKKYNIHCADSLAHKVADTVNVITSPDATDQTTANTLLNEIKTDYNLHIASTTYHYTADSTNAVSAAAASSAGTSQTLATAIKAAFNAHIVGAPGGSSIELIDP